MEITPRYDAEPIVALDGAPRAVGVPLTRQRRRFAALLQSLTTEQLAAQSRCADWRVQDVAVHLTGVDQYWALSVASGLNGKPTRFLAGFDPKATPAAIVAAKRDASPEDVVAECVAAIEAFCGLIESLSDDGWAATVETPLGHVSVSALCHHALWDAWVHERDVVVPLGLEQEQHDDELAETLRYAAALSPVFGLLSASRTGTVAFDATDPDLQVVVTVTDSVKVTGGTAPEGALVLAGSAAELIEALSVRMPLAHDIPTEQAWLVTSLGEVFESTV